MKFDLLNSLEIQIHLMFTYYNSWSAGINNKKYIIHKQKAEDINRLNFPLKGTVFHLNWLFISMKLK